MYTPVSRELQTQLCRVYQIGGVEVRAGIQFSQLTQGRMHDVYLVQTPNQNVILQCLNPQVIKCPSALEALINDLLSPASLAPALQPWPATDACVLQTDSGSWIRRAYIDGQTMTAHLSVKSFEAMADTLKHFHQSLAVADLVQTNFTGINPWSGDATPIIEKLHKQSSEITPAEKAVVSEWARFKQIYGCAYHEASTTRAVVHRDAKPSNFIQKSKDGSLVLIDFDTVGSGDPAFDLGEVLRAWLSADELVAKIDSASPCPSNNSIECGSTSQQLAVNSINCTRMIQALYRGYNEPKMTVGRILKAAAHCCLWQCERYLADHFAGNVYYSVQIHGDNLLRSEQQLKALTLLGKL